MNLPNKLSIIRIICVPVIALLLSFENEIFRYYAVAVFVLASLTDFLDGFIARKNHIITDFGKFIDPIADKLLVLSTMIMLLSRNQLPAWFIILLLARELCIDGLRLIAAVKKIVIAAGPLGKIKTVSQMALILFLMIFNFSWLDHWVGMILLYISGLVTFISGTDYFIRNKSVFKE